MAAPIQSPAKWEVRSIIWFLNAKGEHPAEIHKQIVAVYGSVIYCKNVTKWCREFSEGRTHVHDEQRSGRPALISYDFLQEIEEEICSNRHVMIRELHHIIPEVSKSTIHEAVTEKLGYRKLCAHWVPKMITDDHKTKWVGSTLKFLMRYKEMSLWTPLWLEMKRGFFTTLLNPSNSHCNGAICILPEPKISKLQFQWKKSWRPFSGTEKAFFWSTSCLLLQQLMPLHIVTPWHGFNEPFKTKEGNVVMQRVPAPQQRVAPFRACHHCASGKIQVGYIGPSTVRSGPRAQRFPLVSSPRGTSRWEKVLRRWWGAKKVMTWFKGQVAYFYDSGLQELDPRLNKYLDIGSDYVEK